MNNKNITITEAQVHINDGGNMITLKVNTSDPELPVTLSMLHEESPLVINNDSLHDLAEALKLMEIK